MRRAMRAAAAAMGVLLVAAALATVTPATPAQAEAPYYSPSATEGSIYRLYRAYFLREPDTAGFAYWYLKVAEGTSLDGVSEAFAGSSEFRTRYGALDDVEFVDLVYENVLGRSADPGGRDHWVGRLEAGVSRGRVMRSFSESSEYQRDTAAACRPGGGPAPTPAPCSPGCRSPPSTPVRATARVCSRTGTTPTTTGATPAARCWRTRSGATAPGSRGGTPSSSRCRATSTSTTSSIRPRPGTPAPRAGTPPTGTPSPTGGSTSWRSARRSNTSKGDRDAAGWTPPRTKSNCLFAEITITTKQHWGLSVDPAEKAALGDLLDGCGRTTSASPPVTGPPASPPTVMLYGDSLSVETGAYFSWYFAPRPGPRR